MLSKKHRFHGLHSLDFTYRRGKTVRGQLLSLRFSPAKGDSYRLAVVVSKKVQKSAVVRNRIRRRIYEAARQLDKEIGLPACDMIVSVYDERVAEQPANELARSIRDLIEKSRQKPTKTTP